MLSWRGMKKSSRKQSLFIPSFELTGKEHLFSYIVYFSLPTLLETRQNPFCFDVALQEGDKRQLREASLHPPSSERYVHTFRDLSNFSGAINVTYRYLAGTPLNRKSKFHTQVCCFVKGGLLEFFVVFF